MEGNNHLSARRLSSVTCVILISVMFLVKVRGQNCQNKVDIVILLDSSGSVGLENFDKMKQFLVKSIAGFSVGPNSIQIGLVTFSPARTHFNLNTFSSSSAVENAINNVPYYRGATLTYAALSYIGNSFNTSEGDRLNAQDLLVVITDGKSGDTFLTVVEANKLKRRHVKIMAIGIGSDVNRNELIGIASDSSLMFEVKDFDALSRFTNEIYLISCRTGEIITSAKTTMVNTLNVPSTSTNKTTTITTTSTTVSRPSLPTTLTSTTRPITLSTHANTIRTSFLTTSTTTTTPTTRKVKISSTSPTTLTTKTMSIFLPTTTMYTKKTPMELPVVIVSHSHYTTQYGKPVSIDCKVVSSTYPLLDVFWGKNDSGIITKINNDTAGIEGVSIANPSLTIKHPMANSTYTCKARNIFGTQNSTEVQLIVIGGPPTVTVQSVRYSVIYGSPVVLNCAVHSILAVTVVYWKVFYDHDKDIARFIHTGDFLTAGITTDEPSLTLMSPMIHDSGEYFCYARNDAGPTLSTAISLKVNGGVPEVYTGSVNYTVRYGQGVTLNCTVVSSPPHTEVFWEKKRQLNNGITIIRQGEPGTSGSTNNMPALTINATRTTDPGHYFCAAKNMVGIGVSQETVLNVIGGVPQVQIHSRNYSSVYGEQITLQCSVKSDPPHSNVFWQYSKNGTNSWNLNNKATGTQGISIQNPSLTIVSSNFAHTGYYTCYASNEIGYGKSEDTILKVTGGVPEVHIGSFNYTVKYGHRVTLNCTVVSSPYHSEVYWEKTGPFNDGKTIIRQGESGTSGSTNNNPSLTINTTRLTDRGHYICVAKNKVGTGLSQETILEVLGGVPHVRINSRNYSSVFGGQITLHCSVQSDPPHSNVYWQYSKDGSNSWHLNNGATGIQGITIQNPSLTILATNFAHTGYYTCYASNEIGYGKSEDTFLKVFGDTPTVTTNTLKYTVEYGKQVAFDCEIHAIPIHTEVYWLKTIQSNITRKIPSTSRPISIHYYGSTLKIKEVRSSDVAQYRCVAVNSVGEGYSSEITLKVNGEITTLTTYTIAGIPIVKRTHEKYKAAKGYSVTINCMIESEILKIQTVYWKVFYSGKDNRHLIRNGEVGIDGVNANYPSLIINEVSVSMAGEYICCAVNKAGDACGLPSNLIVESNLEQSKDENGNTAAEKTETVVAIISGLIAIIGALATTFKKRKKLRTLLNNLSCTKSSQAYTL